MKRLILMRHAKSSWNTATGSDKERPLNDRGKVAASLVGQWLESKSYAPKQAFVSTATRCQQTWDILASELIDAPVPDLRDGLYLAEPDKLLALIRASASEDVVMVLAHQPGIGAFARALRVDPAPHHDSFNKYPTGAVTVLDFSIEDWSELGWGTGVVDAFVAPRELPA